MTAMLGLTTTRHHRTVVAELEERLNKAFVSAELERRRHDRQRNKDRKHYRGRLDSLIKGVVRTRQDLAAANGTVRRLAEQLVDEPRPVRVGGRS
ncbi:hypothetical protein [Streptomyces sp. NPDC102487]|uniref:hypothetical protein n=1 Tax=Streptomyces sp. NPDC102487 TaxID=3366182 RepID=UPI003826E4BC